MKRPSHTSLILALLLAFGFALRLALHDFHGLEGDDAFSLALSRYSLPVLVRGLMRLELDIHPPVHFVMVKTWVALMGESLLALRVMNIFLDGMSVTILARVLNRVTKGVMLPIVCVLVWSLSPLLISGGWLIRMYTLLGFWVACLLWVTVTSSRWRWVVWGVAGLGALYTHIIGAVIFASATVVLIGTQPRRRRWLVAFALMILALWLPFALPTVRLFTSDTLLGASVNPTYQLASYEVPTALLTTVLAHRMVLPNWAGWGLLASWVICWGIAWRQSRLRPLLAFVALTWAGMAVLGVGAHFFKPRYLVPFGMVWLLPYLLPFQRPLRVTGIACAVTGVAVLGLRLDVQHGWRDDWVAGTRYVSDATLPQDAVVIVPDWGQEAFRYHYNGEAPSQGFFPQIAPTLNLSGAFEPLLIGRDRAWLVRYQPLVSDPHDLALDWFRGRYPLVSEAYPAGMHIQLYDLQPIVTAPQPTPPLNITFAETLTLRGIAPLVTEVFAHDERLHPPNGRVLVVLYWEATQPHALTPRVRLTDPFGQVYGEAIDYGVPAPALVAGELVRVHYDLNLNPETPRGRYNIEVMVLDNGVPVTAQGDGAGATWFIAGQVMVR